ncbi:MAG TPA: hypothetical protein VFZ40_11080 [Pyrinomonadaceae bacterium]
MSEARPLLPLLLTVLLFSPVFAQDQAVPVCSEKAFAAVRPLPKLAYECSESLIDSDSRILRLPRRRAALARVVETLRSFTNPVWWETSLAELNACELHGGSGELSEEEKARWRTGDLFVSLMGDEQTRLVLIADPCYQTGFNGANAFVLHRRDGHVFVTQVLDGYYSRADNSVGINFANLKGQRIIEVTTGNSMPPSLVSYFFAIDRSGRATPKRIFRTDGRLTNEIYSAMLMAEPRDLNLPAGASELNIIRSRRLAPRFSAYEEHERGPIDAQGRRLRRVVYRWNGRFYSRTN